MLLYNEAVHPITFSPMPQPRDDNGQSEKQSARVAERVSPALRARLDNFARQQNTSPAAVIRALLARLPAAGADEPIVAPPEAPRQQSRSFQPKTAKVDLRFSPAERDAFDRAVKQYGAKSRAALGVAVIRTAILKQPQPLDTEIQELRAANRALSAVGTNLNQIARRLNEQPGPPDGLAESLTQLRGATRRQRDAIAAVLKATEERWA